MKTFENHWFSGTNMSISGFQTFCAQGTPMGKSKSMAKSKSKGRPVFTAEIVDLQIENGHL